MKKKSSIYLVHLFNDYSGSPRVLCDAVDALVDAGFDCNVLTSQHKGFLNNSKSKNICIPYLRSNSRWLILFNFIFSQVYCFLVLAFLLIKERLNGSRATVMVNTMLPFGAYMAAKVCRVQCIAYIHETSVTPRGLKLFLRAVIKACVSDVIYVSEYLAKQEPFGGLNSTVIYNGLRRDLSASDAVNLQKKFDNKTLFFCGSPKSFKGIHQFFMLARHLPEFNLVAALNCEVSELTPLSVDLPKNVTLFSRPSNLFDLYAGAFLVLNLSIPDECVETFGLSILEGMALGCPAIAPPVGGPCEIVNENVGILIDCRNIEAIASFVIKLSSEYSLWAKYSEAAVLQASKFSAEQYSANIVAYFNSINNAKG
ncbi:glycosyltransferase family 4 protein [Marinagarivorans algicola]|uniref:glycosyltransferase family 4 protein n=1 Tax=Marinagarivorans algicola TaxID=1513270 RepID=UPI0037355299